MTNDHLVLTVVEQGSKERCSAIDNKTKHSTGFNDNIIIITKTAVTNLPEVRNVKRIPLCIDSQHQYCRTTHIKYRTDLACSWQLK